MMTSSDNKAQSTKRYGRQGLEERVKALADLLDFETFVSKLQRRLGPARTASSDPSAIARSTGKGAFQDPDETSTFEVFVGALSTDIFEDELYELVTSKIGPDTVELIRVMTNDNGDNRGFAFVRLKDKDSCFKLVRELNDYELRPKRLIKANYSPPNVRLYVANLPKNKDKDELKDELERVSEGVKEVIIHQGESKNRGFCFVDYYTHPLAKTALRKLNRDVQLFGHNVYAEWAEPFTEVDPEIMAKVRTLYVKNISSDVTEETLKEVFGAYGEIEKIRLNKSYAFIHFVERDYAIAAKDNLSRTKIGRNEIEIDLARPMEASAGPKSSERGRGGRGGGRGRFNQSADDSWFPEAPRGRGGIRGSPGRGGRPPRGRGTRVNSQPLMSQAYYDPYASENGYVEEQYDYGYDYAPVVPARGRLLTRGAGRGAFQPAPSQDYYPVAYGSEGYAQAGYYDESGNYVDYGAYGGGEAFYEDTEAAWANPVNSGYSNDNGGYGRGMGRLGKRPAVHGSDGAIPPKRTRGAGPPRRARGVKLSP